MVLANPFLTHLIHAVFAGMHAFIGTNIYYSDEELRKQEETLVGKLIVTAQETGEGSVKSMRQGLYKKHMSGDPVPARLPDGVRAKLVVLIGWKRIEMNTLIKIGAWTQVEKTDNMNVILSTWAFRIKRFPSGLVRKLKARFCVRSDLQRKGIDVFETFAPVVSWTTVRLLLILSVILDLHSTQVDYTAAFCQAPIDTDVYVGLPNGWKELNKSAEPVMMVGCAGGTDALSCTASYLAKFPVVSCPPEKDDINMTCLKNPPGSSNAFIAKPSNIGKFAAQYFASINPEVSKALDGATAEKITKLEKADTQLLQKA